MNTDGDKLNMGECRDCGATPAEYEYRDYSGGGYTHDRKDCYKKRRLFELAF